MISRHAILAETRAWLGTPYQHQASARGAGCDCLGLVRGVWRALHGAEPEDVPAYTPDWAERGGRETLLNAALRHLVKIPLKEAAPGDVLLFRMDALAPVKHCAILETAIGTRQSAHACSPSMGELSARACVDEADEVGFCRLRRRRREARRLSGWMAADLSEDAPPSTHSGRELALAATSPIKGEEGSPAAAYIIHAYWGRAVVRSRFAPWWRARWAASFQFPDAGAWPN